MVPKDKGTAPDLPPATRSATHRVAGMSRAFFPHPNQPRPAMTTKLDKPLKREIDLDGTLYTVTMSAEGVKVVEKGKGKGQELSWRDIISGDARLAQDLQISLDATME